MSTIEEWCHLFDGCEQVKWINTTPYDPSDPLPNLIEEPDSDSEIADYSPPGFVPEGGNGAAQPDEDDESIISINGSEGAPPNMKQAKRIIPTGIKP